MEQRLVQGLHVYEHMEAGPEEVAAIAEAIAIANDISVNIEDMFQNDLKGILQHKYVPYIQQLEVCRAFRLNDFAGKRWTTSEKKATLLTAIGYRRGDLLEFSMACESCQDYANKGVCNGCVVIPQLQEEGLYACMNCNYQGLGSSCSFNSGKEIAISYLSLYTNCK